MKNKVVGKCQLCGKNEELTFEHVPPKAAFNDKPVLVQKHEHMFNEKSYVYGKSMRSNQGAGSYSLCKLCNNNTGTWYARDFADFTQQGMENLDKLETVHRYNIAYFKIKPLNVLKQILTMFLSVDKSGYLQKDKKLVSYLLDKESNDLPEKYKVYLYNTLSDKSRMMGIQWNNINNIFCTHSEISFNPFGYFLAVDSPPSRNDLTDITIFNKYKFNQEANGKVNLVFLNIDTMFLGHY